MALVYIEVKREAGKSGDAQQEGMANHLKDHATEAVMKTWQTLRPALLLMLKKHELLAQASCTLLVVNLYTLAAAAGFACIRTNLSSTLYTDLPCRLPQLWGQVYVSLACAWMPLPLEYASRCHLPWTCYSCHICLTPLQVWLPCSALCPNWSVTQKCQCQMYAR